MGTPNDGEHMATPGSGLRRRIRAARATSWGRAMAWMLVARLLVLATILASAWLVEPTHPGLDPLLQIAAGVWLPTAVLIAWRRLRGEDLVRRTAAVAADMSFALAAIALVPDTAGSVLAFLVVVIAAEARSAQLIPALSVSVPAIVVAAAAQRIAPDQVSVAMVLTFAASALALPIVLVQFRGRHVEQRRQLSRLYRSLSTIPDPSDIEATITVIADATQQALNAELVEVEAIVDEDDAELLTALAQHGPVVSPNEIAVPLRAGSETVATMAVRLGDESSVTPDDVELLSDFAEVAGLALLRARALDTASRAESQLRDSEQLHGEMMSSMTHELRTPLTTIRGFVETLLHHGGQLSEDQRRHMLEAANRNATTLSHRISEILEFSRLEAQRVTVEPSRQPLKQVVDRIVSEAAGMLTRHKVAVQVPERIWVMADEVALGHILTNLLSNSAKYSDTGSHIVVGARFSGDDMVVVSVTDHGRGIPPEDTERVFGRYERVVRTADGTPRPGTGIGLAIVQRYVEMGGGKVWLDSVPGVGTTVSFTLPRGDTVPPWEADGSAWLRKLPEPDTDDLEYAGG